MQQPCPAQCKGIQYGIPAHQPAFCIDHAPNGCVKGSFNRCVFLNCIAPATHSCDADNINEDPQFCKQHAQSNGSSLLIKRCPKCKANRTESQFIQKDAVADVCRYCMDKTFAIIYAGIQKRFSITYPENSESQCEQRGDRFILFKTQDNSRYVAVIPRQSTKTSAIQKKTLETAIQQVKALIPDSDVLVAILNVGKFKNAKDKKPVFVDLDQRVNLLIQIAQEYGNSRDRGLAIKHCFADYSNGFTSI